MDLLKFVTLDDKTHAIGPGEYTVCGLVIPQGETYVTEQPAKGMCSECKSRIKGTDEFGVLRSVQEEAAPEPLNDTPVEPPADALASDEQPAGTVEAEPVTAPTPTKKASGAKAAKA